jgi:hypothetical protein
VKTAASASPLAVACELVILLAVRLPFVLGRIDIRHPPRDTPSSYKS